MDSIYREPSEPVQESSTPVHKEPKDKTTGQIDDGVEVPYTDYEASNRKPFSVDYFKLGNAWDDPEGGYSEEISTVEEYLKSRVDRGDIANSLKSIKQELQKLEKTNNLKDEERIPIKLGTIAAYVKFIMQTDHIKFNVKRYGSR